MADQEVASDVCLSNKVMSLASRNDGSQNELTIYGNNAMMEVFVHR